MKKIEICSVFVIYFPEEERYLEDLSIYDDTPQLTKSIYEAKEFFEYKDIEEMFNNLYKECIENNYDFNDIKKFFENNNFEIKKINNLELI